MSFTKGKERFTVQSPLSADQRLLLIRTVRKYPRIYKNEFLRTPFLPRNEKQQLWDKIAEESGFEKTEDAKCKWRSLINYLRQHLDHVAQKKTRRYIPISDNPDDKYMQLTDWPFYTELEFLVPYVKYAASNQFNNGANYLEITPTELDLIIDGIEAEIEQKNEQNEKRVSKDELKQNLQPNEDINAAGNNCVAGIDTAEKQLSENDKILKEFFENMLKSALKLPRFHQNLIKENLRDCINEQKALNKIN